MRTVHGVAGSDMVDDSANGLRVQITNLRGDIVAQSTPAGVISTLTRVDEFGVPKAALPAGAKYAFHGSKQREALTSGGMIAMGVRLYQPQMGRFMQVDPVLGGTANPYEYPSDPVNEADLSGKAKHRFKLVMHLGPRQTRKLINFLEDWATAIDEEASKDQLLAGLNGVALGVANKVRVLAKRTFVGAAGLSAAGLISAYDLKKNASKLRAFVKSLRRRMEECGGRGVNIVVKGEFDKSARLNVYRSGKNDVRGTAHMSDWYE